jgi:hypothetical protein
MGHIVFSPYGPSYRWNGGWVAKPSLRNEGSLPIFRDDGGYHLAHHTIWSPVNGPSITTDSLVNTRVLGVNKWRFVTLDEFYKYSDDSRKATYGDEDGTAI